MQSESKTRTYIVTVAEQAQEQPVAQTDQKSGIGKCDKSFSGLMETQQEPCKSDKPKITMAETMNITLMVATLALLLWSSIFVTLVAKKYHESVTLPSGLRMVYDNH